MLIDGYVWTTYQWIKYVLFIVYEVLANFDLELLHHFDLISEVGMKIK